MNLYLPNFNSVTVEKVKSELEGAIPAKVDTHPTKKQRLELLGNLPCGISRKEVFDAINEAKIDSYAIPKKGVSDYRTALFKLCHLLVRTKLYRDAIKDLLAVIVGQITSYVQKLEDNGQYEQVMDRARVMNDMVVSLDALGTIITDDLDAKAY